MAKIREFAAIRPKEGLEERIAALPYDVYSRREAKAETEREPFSFLRIDRAETQLSDETPTDSPLVYEKARKLLWDMVKNGELVRDASPCFYLYELTMDGRAQTGLVACASIDDYETGVIKKHENTRADKEEDRVRHVDVCSAQTGPIFLTYRKQEAMECLTRRIKEQLPVFAFTAADGVEHRGWKISDPEEIRNIRRIFDGVEHVYIADGHHRAASAVRVGKLRRAAHPGYTGQEEFNWFLSVLFPDDELRILDYNRVVKDLGGLSPEAFLNKLRTYFSIEESDRSVVCAHK